MVPRHRNDSSLVGSVNHHTATMDRRAIRTGIVAEVDHNGAAFKLDRHRLAAAKHIADAADGPAPPVIVAPIDVRLPAPNRMSTLRQLCAEEQSTARRWIIAQVAAQLNAVTGGREIQSC